MITKSIKKELMFIFTSMLPKLTKMNRYMPQHGSRALVGPMANTLYIPPQYVENNPIDQFEYQANKVIKALEQCNEGNAVQVCSASRSSLLIILLTIFLPIRHSVQILCILNLILLPSRG